MTRQPCTLGDLIRIKHGYAFKGEHFADSGRYVLLTPGNFEADGGLRLKGEKEKYYAGNFPREFLLCRGDLLVVMTDLTQSARILGSPAVVPKDDVYLHNQRLGKVIDIDEKRVDRRYLYHVFNYTGVREQLKASATGSTVRHTAPDRIYAVRIFLPSLSEQRRIASILSAYDDLIENNARRIAILEEMARRVYEEWFVRFRFPGHENVRMVESELGPVPEGWRVAPLREIGTITMGLSPKGDTYNENGDGTPLVNGPVEFGDRFTKKMKWTTAPTKLCKAGDLIVCVRGSTTGKYVKSDDVYCLGRGVCAIGSDYQSFISQLFIHQLPDLLAQTGGSTFPSWTGPQLKEHAVAAPPTDVLVRFESIVEPMSRAILAYSRKNSNLRITRDLLLPKLIAGEFDVSFLPEPEAAVA